MWYAVYEKTYTRLSPYIFGMIAALRHRADKDRKILENSSVCGEWLAFLMFFWIGFDPAEGLMLHPDVLKFWYSLYRPLYGLCLAHLIKLMISPAPEDTIPMHRPTKFLRAFFSMSMWVPIANLSYSVYLWHIIFLSSLENGYFGL